MQRWLERAALAEGYPPAKFGSHSLRIDGATALLHAGYDVAMIKRMGRWASDAFEAYLWEADTDARDVARRMADDNSTLMVTRMR